MAGHFFHAAPVLGPDRALRYLLAAAEAAQTGLAFERAEDDLRRALSLVELLPVAERLELEFQVQNRLVALLIATRGHAAFEVGLACTRARRLCEQIGETDGLLMALNNLAAFHYLRGETRVVAELGGQILGIGSQRQNPLWQVAGHLTVGIAQLHMPDLAAARDSFTSLRHAAAHLDMAPQEVQALLAVHPVPVGLAFSAWAEWYLCNEAVASAFADAGLEMATRLANPYRWQSCGTARH